MTQQITHLTQPNLTLLEKYIKGCQRCQSVEVEECFMPMSHAVTLMGFGVASSLVVNLVETQESPKYFLPANQRQKYTISKGIAQFNSSDLLEALLNVRNNIQNQRNNNTNPNHLPGSQDDPTQSVQVSPVTDVLSDRTIGDGKGSDETSS
jgi:hypothetical protein